MSKPIELDVRDRWIRAVLANRVGILLVAGLITAVAAVLAARLHIDSDLRSLLPPDHEVVRNLERIDESFGALGSINVVVKGASASERHAFADALAIELGNHPMLVDVEYRLPSDFFAEHALYYLSEREMAELQERIEAWQHYELCTAEPDLCIGEVDPSASEALRKFIESKRDSAWQRAGFRDYYEREGIPAQVVLLHPAKPSSDLAFTADVTRDVRERIAALYSRSDAPWWDSQLTYNIVGPYVTKADEQVTIRHDMAKGLIVGVAGVIVILYALFRSWRAVLTLLVPLTCGVTWSMGATELMLGHLNTMTSLISTVIMGIGIDAGIHVLSRAMRERARYDHHEAIARAFHGLVVPLFVASGTTIGAFMVMATSDFPAFHEFGVIAAVGVMLCLLAMTTVFPALLGLVGIKQHKRTGEQPIRRIVRLVLVRPGLLFILLVATTVLSFQGVRRVSFEYNGRKLQSDRARQATESDTRLISDIFGKDIHAGILVVDTLERARQVLERARQRRDARAATGRSVVAELFAAPDLLPPVEVDQNARQAAIAAIRDDLPDHVFERLERRAAGQSLAADDKSYASAMTPEDARRLRNMLDAQPFAFDDIPAALQNKVRGQNGTFGVFAYPNFDAADIRHGVEFMHETRSYLDRGDEGVFVGETTVYAAMYTMMWEETPIVLGMASILVAAFVFWQLRSLSQTIITLLPLAIGMWWLLGWMGVTALSFTLFNMPIVPAILGIGVDNGVYLTDQIRKTRADVDGLARSLQETGGAILAAWATTVAGFAAFSVADSGGLRTLGLLAIDGITMAALAALLVLPTLAALGDRRRRKRGSH